MLDIIKIIVINYIMAPNNTYIDKTGPFECGFTSFRQSRITYTVSFILIAILLATTKTLSPKFK